MKYLLIAITVCSFIFISCEGPAGSDGKQGPQGEQGVAGEDGADGSANVTSFTTAWNENDVQFNDNETIAWVTFEVNGLTSEVVENAAIMAYYNQTLGSADGWITLPLSTQTMEYTYSYAEGIFEVDMMSTDTSGISSNEVIEGRVKIVIIPPSSNQKINSEDWENRIKVPGLISNN